MEDFFKRFRENLEQRTEPDFDLRDWEDMQSSLDRAGQKRPSGFAWWMIAIPALLLLSASDFLFYKKLQQANQKIAVLETDKDTVFHTRVIYIRDTVYQIRTSQANPAHHRFPRLPVRAFNYPILRNAWTKEIQNEQPKSALSNLDTSLFNHVIDFKTSFDLDINQKKYPAASIKTVSINEAKSMFRPKTELPEIPVKHAVVQRKKSFGQIIDPIRPKTFQVGVSGGWVLPLHKELNNRKGYMIGAEFASKFSDKFSLWADLYYSNVFFETDKMDPSKGVPVVPPLSDAFTFIKAEVQQPSLQYSMGILYKFRVKKTIQPFIGLGYGGVSVQPYEVMYEFKDQTLGIEWNYDKEIIRHQLLNNLLIIRTGVEHRFSKRWIGVIRANYRIKLGETVFFTPKTLEMQAGFHYLF